MVGLDPGAKPTNGELISENFENYFFCYCATRYQKISLPEPLGYAFFAYW